MTVDTVTDIARTTLMLIIRLSAPMLLTSMIVGLVISIFQTITSIQEQTLSFVPKLIVTFLALMLTGGWIYTELSDFTTEIFTHFSEYIGSGAIFYSLLK